MNTKVNTIHRGITIDEKDFTGIESCLKDEDIIDPFVCILCYGIAISPVKCSKCETVYCLECLPEDVESKFKCYKMCGSQTLLKLGRIEMNILKALTFKCQHAEEYKCTAIVKYENIRKHLENDCVHKIQPKLTSRLEKYYKLKCGESYCEAPKSNPPPMRGPPPMGMPPPLNRGPPPGFPPGMRP